MSEQPAELFKRQVAQRHDFFQPAAPGANTPQSKRDHRDRDHGDGYDEPDYEAIYDSPAFVALRRRTLRFIIPTTALFIGNYMMFVLLSAYAPALMGIPAVGSVNVGMLVGMFQFVSTMVIVGCYCLFSGHPTDRMVEQIVAEHGSDW